MPRSTVLTFPPAPEPPPLDETARLVRLAARELRVDPANVVAVRPVRVSFDARRRQRCWRVELSVFLRGEEVPPEPAQTPPRFAPLAEKAPRVLVVGSGPAGLFCALDLLAAGLRPAVVERGRDVRTRRRAIAALNRGMPPDPESNYCFGEGGAGTYSDGKLYTRSGKKPAIRGVLETLVAHGAPPQILTSWRPHVGSNRLPEVVTAMRESILAGGGSVRFGYRAESLEVEALPGGSGARRVTGAVLRDLDTGELERLDCRAVVLATGHSALDSIRMAARAGARLVPKGFAMGVRIEHPQPWLDEVQYGGLRGGNELPAAFYELADSTEGRGVYSFCMCPGGFIVPATTSFERVVVNGMSLSRRDSPFANSGLVVAVEPEDWCGASGTRWGWDGMLRAAERLGPSPFPPTGGELPREPGDDPLFGVRLQQALERLAAHAGGGGNRAPAQRADAFLEGARGPAELPPSSYRPGLTVVDLGALLPAGMTERLREGVRVFDARLPGFAGAHGQLVGVETRTSSPVRIERDPSTLASPAVEGLYPCGEGAGFAGGIVSAALDGRRVAAAVAAAVLG